MGLLDQVIGNVLGSRMGGQGRLGQSGGLGGMLGGTGGGGMSPAIMAILALLASRQTGRGGQQGGGLGDLLGGGGGGLGGLLSGAGGGLGGLLGGGGAGGLGGLLDQFRQRGYGDHVDSWVSHGENRQLAPNELEDALGPDTVENLSQQTGMQRDEFLNEVSGMIPHVVDGLTPQGRLPTDDEARHW